MMSDSMTQSDSIPLTWVIQDFPKLPIFSECSQKFECKQNTFWLAIFSKDSLKCLDNHTAIYLCREKPHSTDLKVMWTIWLINDRGEECYRKDIETIYSAGSKRLPIYGGLYNIDREIILNSSNGLLPDGNLTVKLIVNILDGCKIDEKKIRLEQKKTIENYESSSLAHNIESILVDDSLVEKTYFDEHLERNEAAAAELHSVSTSSSGNHKRKPPTGVSASKENKKAKTRSGGHNVMMIVCKFLGCGRFFSHDLNLAIHERIHLGIKPFTCTWPDCKYASAKRGHVVRHIRSRHFNLLQYVNKQIELSIVDDRDPNEFVRVNQQLASLRLLIGL